MQLEWWKQGNPEIQSEKASQTLGVIRTCNYFFHISHAYRNMVQLHFPASVKLSMAMYLHQWSVRENSKCYSWSEVFKNQYHIFHESFPTLTIIDLNIEASFSLVSE